jgi:hypothetical protein
VFHFSPSVATKSATLACSSPNISNLCWRKPEFPERTTDEGQATGKLYHLRLRVECTLFVIYKAGLKVALSTKNQSNQSISLGHITPISLKHFRLRSCVYLIGFCLCSLSFYIPVNPLFGNPF